MFASRDSQHRLLVYDRSFQRRCGTFPSAPTHEHITETAASVHVVEVMIDQKFPLSGQGGSFAIRHRPVRVTARTAKTCQTTHLACSLTGQLHPPHQLVQRGAQAQARGLGHYGPCSEVNVRSRLELARRTHKLDCSALLGVLASSVLLKEKLIRTATLY